MEEINFDLLKRISETPGAPGFEKHIRNLIVEEVTPWVDDLQVDNMGNVIAYRNGREKKKVMLAAHMDEIGFIVNHIDDDGFLRFIPLGGFDPKTLTSQRVVVHGEQDLIGVMGTKPVHMMSDEEKKRQVKIEDFFIDLGMPKEEVEKYVQVGNPVTRNRELIRMGDCVNGKSLDNRISVYILIEALKAVHQQDLPFDVYGVFTVQEEVGIRGAQVATQEIQPDFGIAIDTTIAYDVPGAQSHQNVTKLGRGAAIKMLDATAIADYRMVEYMKEVAARHQVAWQPELMAKGGTDTGMVQRMTRSGSIAGAVSVPTRHIHQVIESVNNQDILSSVNLLQHCLLELDQKEWSHHP
jgi:endoglucanase